MIALRTWQAPGGSEELAIAFGPDITRARLLVLPAWFDESNKLRHLTIATMRILERLGVASVLPDLPGCNESLAPLDQQDLAQWRNAAAAASAQFDSTHVLAIRAAVHIAPDLPGWAYAPLAGKSALRALVRARVLAAREAGLNESSEALLERGRSHGVELAGYRLGASLVAGLAAADLPENALLPIAPADLGGAGLWLRAEPGHDPAQAEALAQIVGAGMAG